MTFSGPSDLIPDAVVDERDARTAQTVLDAWLGPTPAWPAPPEEVLVRLPALRGILVQVLADTRAAGVLEGYRAGQAAGRLEVARALRDALDGVPVVVTEW